METLIILLVSLDIIVAAAAFVYAIRGFREITQMTRADDAAIFLQGRRIEEILKEMREELKTA